MQRLLIILTLLSTLSVSNSFATNPPAPVPRTGQTTSYAAGDDGALQQGVAWPSPRFADNNDGTVIDNLTGLVWLKNANCFNTQTWAKALTSANALANGACGLIDGSTGGQWRLPTVKELESIVDTGHTNPALPTGQLFSLVQNNYYWSSSSSAESTVNAWYVTISNGYVGYDSSYRPNDISVWPVRSGNSTATAPVAKTGQTTSYASGDDGALEPGVAWPSPRFTDNGNGTTTDNLTGLVWLKNANCFNTQTWANALTSANALASGACGLADGSSTGDWRLPNSKELMSIVNYGQANQSIWLNTQGFSSVQAYGYWSSGTLAYTADRPTSALYTHMGNGHTGNGDKAYSLNVWPVRSGQTSSSTVSTFNATTGGVSIPSLQISGDTSGASYAIGMQQGNGLVFSVTSVTAATTSPSSTYTAIYNATSGAVRIPYLTLVGDTSGASYSVNMQQQNQSINFNVTGVTPN